MSSSHENLSPQVLQAIARELRKLVQKPLDGITVVVNETNLTDIQAEIQGPVGTPYEGGVFRCKLVSSASFYFSFFFNMWTRGRADLFFA